MDHGRLKGIMLTMGTFIKERHMLIAFCRSLSIPTLSIDSFNRLNQRRTQKGSKINGGECLYCHKAINLLKTLSSINFSNLISYHVSQC